MSIGHSSPTAITEEWGEGHIIVPILWPESVTQGQWGYSPNAAYITNTIFYNVGYADLDQVNYSIWLSKGTYSLSVIYVQNTNTAIIDFLLDSVSLGTQDAYGAANYTALKTFTGIVVSKSKKYSFSIKANGKNASSSAYYVEPSTCAFWRTA
jgi:hypothetical protein